MVHLRRINKWRVSSTKILIIALILTIVVFTLIWNIFILSMNDSVSKNKGLYCLNLSGNKLPELDESEPKLGSAIFFHETSCPEDMSDIFLNARQACSVESALRAHPYTGILFFYLQIY